MTHTRRPSTDVSSALRTVEPPRQPGAPQDTGAGLVSEPVEGQMPQSADQAGPSTNRASAALRRRLRGVVPLDDTGMTTAEYAVGTVAACGFAGILYTLLTSDQVTKLLGDVIKRALVATF